MRRPTRILALALAVSSTAGGALAAAGPGELTVAVDESRRIALHGVAATIAVDDARIADVAVTDAHSLILIGRGFGVTHLLVTDRSGRTLLDGRVSVVIPDAGRVTVYHGLAASEFACGGARCHQIGQAHTLGGEPAAPVAPETVAAPPYAQAIPPPANP